MVQWAEPPEMPVLMPVTELNPVADGVDPDPELKDGLPV